VGIIGLSVIVLLTSLNGVVEEHNLGQAFHEALPFTALLVVFFAIVAVIHDQHLFAPVINYVISLKGNTQLAAYYIANGVLSMISDNVFVATVYISETKTHITQVLGHIPDIGMTGAELMDKLTASGTLRADVYASLPRAAADQARTVMDQFDKLAVAINTGTLQIDDGATSAVADQFTIALGQTTANNQVNATVGFVSGEIETVNLISNGTTVAGRQHHQPGPQAAWATSTP